MVIGTVSGFVCSFSRSEPSTRASTASSFLGMRVDIPGSYRNGVLLISVHREAIVFRNTEWHTEKVGSGFTKIALP
jgi:hypothetical protein